MNGTIKNEVVISAATESPTKSKPLTISENKWPVTRMPDPKIPKYDPEEEGEELPPVALDGFVIPTDSKELYKLWLITEHEYRDATHRQLKAEARLALDKLNLLRPARFKSQQGLPKIANSADQVGQALALYQSSDSEYLKWKYAVEGNYTLKSLLNAYDKLKLDYSLLALKSDELGSINLGLNQTIEEIIPELVAYRLGNYDDAQAIYKAAHKDEAPNPVESNAENAN